MTDSPTLALACELIRRPSVTPEDAGCLNLIGERLARQGFVLERIDAGGVANLWARRGHDAPLVVLAGHTDVVPSGPPERWQSPPFEPTLRDGRLYGRGAADMKTSLAAFVTAIEAFVAEHPDHPGSIALLLTSDEEGPAVHGTQEVVRVLAGRAIRFDHCIVGEPTSVTRLGDTLKNGRRGSLSGRLIVEGIQGHVAYPELVRNPIHLLAPALAELTTTCWDEGNDYFPPTTFQVSNIHAGTGAGNVVPGTCELLFNFRFSTASTVASLQERVTGILDRHRLTYRLDWPTPGRPFLTPRGRLVEALSEAITRTTGVVPCLSTSGGTSDGRFIADLCSEVVECGPVNASIHQIDEWVEVASIEPLAAIYRRTLETLLRPAATETRHD